MTALERARAAWGDDMPDWILVLATACDATSQAEVAARLGRSKTLVSLTVNGRYTRDLRAVEQTVRGVLMAATVNCPVVGELSTDQCLQHQQARGASHNPQRVMFNRACPHCEHANANKGGGHGE